MDARTRESLEGFRPGAYIRMRITNAPCELVECFSPSNPLLIGGVGQGEEKVGYMHLRLKRHRWFPKVLKNRDPLVISAGWRRYQTLPVYSQEDNNGRHRMLKYTPEHMHCRATIFGPLVPPQTGVVAVQNLSGSLSSWRISATAVVMELDARFDIMKKLKLVGHPYRIERHTAYIKDMFTSEVRATWPDALCTTACGQACLLSEWVPRAGKGRLRGSSALQVEVAKFIGASLRTVSGIRGTVKKAARPGADGATPGCFRAAFEDKLVHSDLVMLKAWVAVPVPRFFNPVTNLLARPTPVTRGTKTRAVHKRPDSAGAGASDRGSDGDEPGTAEANGDVEYLKCGRFMGRKAGYKFCSGPCGMGYYTDNGANTGYGQLLSQKAEAPVATAEHPGGETGWVGARTVAQMRREKGMGAPRNTDSLYKEVERIPRIFPALKIPKSLQSALPFASKPKVEAPRSKPTLEQRRAVPLEKDEKKVRRLPVLHCTMHVHSSLPGPVGHRRLIDTVCAGCHVASTAECNPKRQGCEEEAAETGGE
jgi:ribosome biogenesis protein BMS1